MARHHDVLTHASASGPSDVPTCSTLTGLDHVEPSRRTDSPFSAKATHPLGVAQSMALSRTDPETNFGPVHDQGDPPVRLQLVSPRTMRSSTDERPTWWRITKPLPALDIRRHHYIALRSRTWRGVRVRRQRHARGIVDSLGAH
jgi:hypothetical protein